MNGATNVLSRTLTGYFTVSALLCTSAAFAENLCELGYISSRLEGGYKYFLFEETSQVGFRTDASCATDSKCEYEIVSLVSSENSTLEGSFEVENLCESMARTVVSEPNPDYNETFYFTDWFENRDSVSYRGVYSSTSDSFRLRIQIFYSDLNTAELGMWHGDTAAGAYMPLSVTHVEFRTGV